MMVSHVEPGQYVVREGEPGDGLYFILEGEVWMDTFHFIFQFQDWIAVHGLMHDATFFFKILPLFFLYKQNFTVVC